MMDFFKKWYLHEYQGIVYAISVARAEYEKIGSFFTPTLLLLTVLKLYLNIHWWVVPLVILFATISAYWVGKFLIIQGVPKKTAQLGNQQNPELMEILTWIRKQKNANNSIP